MYVTEQQAIQTITDLLRAHGYDPAQYNLLTIVEEYRLETGGYDDVLGNAHIVWAYVDDQHMPAS